jgi:hypothetical protein
MRIINVLLILCISCSLWSQVSLNSKYSVNIDASNKYDALLQLSNQVNHNFSYDASLIKNDAAVRVKLNKANLTTILQHILGADFTGYQMVGTQIVLLPQRVLHDTVHTSSRISGIIFDKSSSEIVEFATIGLKTKQYGTISNIDGRFDIFIDSTDYTDTLFISAMGYLMFTVPVKEVLGKNNIIRLEQNIIPIQEVYVREINPELIIKKSIEATQKHVLRSKTLANAFYREYILKNNNLQSLYEANVDWLISSAGTNIYQYKINKALNGFDARYEDTVNVKLQGGINSIGTLNIAKEEPLFFDKEFMNAYIYTYLDVVSFKERNVYAIGFESRPNYVVTPYEGVLYVDSETLCLLKAEVEQKKSNYNSKFGIVTRKRNRSIKPKVQSTKYVVHYQFIEGDYHLQHIRMEINLRVRKRKSVFNSAYKLVSEIVINDREFENFDRMQLRSLSSRNNIFTDQIKQYTVTFWDKSNYLAPEDVMDKASFQFTPEIK